MTGRGLGLGNISPASGHGGSTLVLAAAVYELATVWSEASSEEVPGGPGGFIFVLGPVKLRFFV